MLVGTADLAAMAADASTVEAFSPEPIELENVVCLQLTAEMHNRAREAVLPPSLHPTVPPGLSFQVYSVGGSPWGEFGFAVARVTCRSGVRARGFTTGAVIRGERAQAGLRGVLGFPARAGEVVVRHGYDGARATVTVDGVRILDITGFSPEPLSADDVQYTGTLNLAHTPRGLRLIQVEAAHRATRVERLTAVLDAFDAAAWGNDLLDPYRVVSASVAVGSLVYPPVRFVCKPDELAFTGTEAVG